jgi:hypothetical protein
MSAHRRSTGALRRCGLKSPPESGVPPYIEVCPGTRSEAHSKSTTTTASDDASHYIAGTRRRRNAKNRLPAYDDCACRDPWTCRCYDYPESPERNAAGYYAAAQHLLAAGLLPAPNVPAMRLMWRRDAEQRELVRYIAERWEVAA